MRWQSMVMLAALAAACGRVSFDRVSGGPGDGGGDGGDSSGVPPSIGFATSTTLADEHSGTLAVVLALSAPAAQPVSVAVDITGGTATAGADYALLTPTVEIASGETQGKVEIMIVDDGLAESDETIDLALASPSGATLDGSDRNEITIAGQPLPRVTFMHAGESGPESDPGGIDIVLDAASTVAISVAFTVSGTAEGSDRTVAAGPIVLQPGEITHHLALGVVDDGLDEEDEMIVITLTSATNAILGAITVETYTILDDDSLPTVAFSIPSSSVIEGTMPDVRVVLSAPSGRTVTVMCMETGGGTAGTDDLVAGGLVTFAPGQTSQPAPITIVDDTFNEDDETAWFVLSNPTNAVLGAGASYLLTILDDDPLPAATIVTSPMSVSEGVASIAIFVQLSAPSGRTVTVAFDADQTGTATLGSDFTYETASPLVFPAGTTQLPISIGIIEDNLDEDDEDVRTVLTSATNAAVSLNTQVITILDNDDPPSVDFVPSSCGQADPEGTGLDTFTTHTLGLTAVSGRSILVSLSLGGTATQFDDYDMSTSIVIPPGSLTMDFQVQTHADSIPEIDESIKIKLTGADHASVGPLGQCTQTIVNDD